MIRYGKRKSFLPIKFVLFYRSPKAGGRPLYAVEEENRAGTRGAADRIVPKNDYGIVIMTIILELPVTAATAALLLFFRKKGDSG